MTTFYDCSLPKTDCRQDNQVRQSVRPGPDFFQKGLGGRYPGLWVHGGQQALGAHVAGPVWNCQPPHRGQQEGGGCEEEGGILPRMAKVTRVRPELPRARASSGSPHE